MIEEALSEPDVPWAYLARGRGDRAVMVDDLVAFVRERTGLQEDVESRLDEYVYEVGGRRTRLVDPWSWLARRLLRRQASRQDVYELPASWVARLGLPPIRPGTAG